MLHRRIYKYNQVSKNKSISIDAFDDMITPKTFAQWWTGPDWSTLTENGSIKKVNIDKPDSTEKFFRNNADNYISRHDITVFSRWSINVVRAALDNISDLKSQYKFTIRLLSPNPSNNNKRFILSKTFKMLSKDVDGFKWKQYFPCNGFNFKQKDALKLFISWLETNSRTDSDCDQGQIECKKESFC